MLPLSLVATASVLVLYKHWQDDQGGDPTKTFLSLIVVQMLPLVFLEKKILSCPDPVSMLSHFGSKVLLMHGCFLGLRICTWPLLEVGIGVCNLIGFVAVCAALFFGFGFRASSLLQQMDLLGLVALGIGGAFLTEVVDFHNHQTLLEGTIFTSANYIEILAFVPAVWMVHQTAKKGEDWSSISGATRERQATAFFSFLVCFYILEDLVSAYRLMGVETMGAAGHIVHFLLLSDFACFLLAHIYNPDKLSGGLQGGGAPSRTSCEAAGPGGQSTLGMTSNPVSTGRVDKPICRPPLLHLEMASLTTGDLVSAESF
eukprot:CAMPEP_0181439754 /NCGR_PEP_ID=MMETSP1110-20121109/22598_1 /TAXON_ID=174948 /ORGANISM="Symbiodinium sp., Strain CCMP421" /LENGTH=314 /DNA_ID=CAMNT_0023563503 /DNA_START=180 /DNA_END=1122 /DNA_ORIENTATION=-